MQFVDSSMFIRAKINHINQTLSEEAWKNLTIGLKSLLREIFECKYQIMGQELTRIYKFVLATYVILVINLPDNILFSCGNILFSCVKNWKSYWIFPVGTEVSAILQFTYQTFFLFFFILHSLFSFMVPFYTDVSVRRTAPSRQAALLMMEASVIGCILSWKHQMKPKNDGLCTSSRTGV